VMWLGSVCFAHLQESSKCEGNGTEGEGIASGL
jgi:hypothetical protein